MPPSVGEGHARDQSGPNSFFQAQIFDPAEHDGVRCSDTSCGWAAGRTEQHDARKRGDESGSKFAGKNIRHKSRQPAGANGSAEKAKSRGATSKGGNRGRGTSKGANGGGRTAQNTSECGGCTSKGAARRRRSRRRRGVNARAGSYISKPEGTGRAPAHSEPRTRRPEPEHTRRATATTTGSFRRKWKQPRSSKCSRAAVSAAVFGGLGSRSVRRRDRRTVRVPPSDQAAKAQESVGVLLRQRSREACPGDAREKHWDQHHLLHSQTRNTGRQVAGHHEQQNSMQRAATERRGVPHEADRRWQQNQHRHGLRDTNGQLADSQTTTQQRHINKRGKVHDD